MERKVVQSRAGGERTEVGQGEQGSNRGGGKNTKTDNIEEAKEKYDDEVVEVFKGELEREKHA
eukprot:749695-Hanusia_phi.AAC.2